MTTGLFKSFWDGHPNHLPFLTLRESEDDPQEWNLQTSIRKLYSILKSSPDDEVDEGIRQLISGEDWRPHLVAVVSILSFESKRRIECIGLLWDRISRGSWVSPQILVVLSKVDEDFASNACRIIDNGFSVNYTQLTAIEHHVSRGGTSATMASAKVVAAINFILNKTTTDSSDSDQGALVARDWEERLNHLIHEGRIHVGKF